MRCSDVVSSLCPATKARRGEVDREIVGRHDPVIARARHRSGHADDGRQLPVTVVDRLQPLLGDELRPVLVPPADPVDEAGIRTLGGVAQDGHVVRVHDPSSQLRIGIVLLRCLDPMEVGSVRPGR